MSSQNRYVKIPVRVKPWVEKYCRYEFGNPILVSLKNPASMIVYSMLQKKDVGIVKDKTNARQSLSELSGRIILVIQRRNRYAIGIFLNPANQVLVNRFLEDLFIAHLACHCHAYKASGKTIQQAIKDFCEQFKIEPDIDVSVEALQKAEFRYRQRKKNLQKDIPELSFDL
jgi:hypothetical protein